MSSAADTGALEVDALVERFFAARRSMKDSPHTTAAYRRDLAAILALIDRDGDGQVSVEQFTAPVLRDAFGAFAATHAKASITRCWSTWYQFLTFLVG